MRILIDGLNLSLPQGTGIATYARNLGRCIRRLDHSLALLFGVPLPSSDDAQVLEAAFFEMAAPPRRSVPRYVWDLARALRPLHPVDIPRTGMVVQGPLTGRLPPCDRILNVPHLFLTAGAKFSRGLGFTEIALSEPVDIAHWTCPLPLRVRGARNIYTIHDLVPLRLPYTTQNPKPKFLRLLRQIAAEADHVATVSETTRADVIQFIGADPARVTNTYQSVEAPEPALLADARAARALLELVSRRAGRHLEPEGFYLFFGAVEPKKNLLRIIRAWASAGVPEPLVVVGREGWDCDAEMAALRGTPGLIWLDYTPSDQLAALIIAARAVVFVSLYEGFGLPVVEAFLCGTPVIASATGALSEIAGDAAILVDPLDEDALREALRGLSAPGSAARRADLAARGRARAAVFSREATSARMGALYDRVMNGV